MNQENIEQPKIYKENDEEKIIEEVNKFIDFLEKIKKEFVNKDLDFKDLSKILTLNRIKLLLKHTEKITNSGERITGKTTIAQMFMALHDALGAAESRLEDKAYFDNLPDAERKQIFTRIFYSMVSIIASRKYFSKEK